MKLQPLYRNPFAIAGFFEPITRREAARLICQWRRNGSHINRMGSSGVRKRGYIFHGKDGESAAMSFNDSR